MRRNIGKTYEYEFPYIRGREKMNFHIYGALIRNSMGVDELVINRIMGIATLGGFGGLEE